MRKCLFLLLFAAITAHGEEPKPTITTIKMEVSPAAAPVPALKIMFTPPLDEAIPGNPVLGYLKCFMEQDNMFARKEVYEEREKLLNMSFEEFRKAKSEYAGELRNFRNYGGVIVRNARRATRMYVLDWNIIQEMQENGYETLLPEIQKLRALTQVVTLQTRGEIAVGDFDSAVQDIGIQLVLAKNLGEHPTFIGTLVGISIARIGMHRVTEFIQEPKSPNLYWALSNLPQPLVRQEQAVLGELQMYSSGFKKFTDPTKIWGKEEIQAVREFAGMANGNVSLSPKKREEVDQWIKARFTDKEWLEKARAGLVSPTRTKEMIAKYPFEQVLFLTILPKALIRQQEVLKYVRLPLPQVAEFLKSTEPTETTSPEEILTFLAVGWTGKARLAQIRLEQQIALLRGVEAVRMYAAANEGKLPPDLKSTGLPVPIDPVTGTPIQYKLDQNKAMIRGTTVPGQELSAEWNNVYEVTIRK